MAEQRIQSPCNECGGTGIVTNEDIDGEDGVHRTRQEPCEVCQGAGITVVEEGAAERDPEPEPEPENGEPEPEPQPAGAEGSFSQVP